MLSAAATSLILLTSLGGTTYPWKSAPIYILGAAGIVPIGVFVLVERRAVEPVLPLHLFRLRTFSTTSVVGFIVGFAMFGAITYLPAFFQVVRGISPTISGVYLLPLMAGLLLTSIGSGQIISRTGKYRFFPIVGTALITSFLLPDGRAHVHLPGRGLHAGPRPRPGQRDAGAGDHRADGVPHRASPTSGATFFRSIGGSFGTAIFGAIFANVLIGGPQGIHLPAGSQRSRRHSGAAGRAAGGARGLRRGLRGVDPDGVPRGRADRRAGLHSHLVHPPGGGSKQWPEPNADATPPETSMAVAGAAVSARCWTSDQPGPGPEHTYPRRLDPRHATTDT